jgi:hypothetical protein
MCRTKVVHISVADAFDAVSEQQMSDVSSEHQQWESSGEYSQWSTPEPSQWNTYGEQPPQCVYPTELSVPVQEPQRRQAMKPWPLIPTDWMTRVFELATFPRGWTFNVYDGRLTSYVEVPSECVVPTNGGIRYVEHYNETGPYSRFRFQVCHNFLNGCCNKGASCTYIHATHLPTPRRIHVMNADGYERLPAGVALCIHLPGGGSRPQMIPSEYILRTEGSEKLYREIAEGQRRSMHRPQHCAHFQFKKVCNRGPDCSFIHSLVPAPQAHTR